MQKPSALQPLTLNNVTKHDEIWSSDSDSGITAGSHSPPSKTTPDSGIGSEQLSWNLPPPPPALLADDAYFPAMEQMEASASTLRAELSLEEEERQRKQEYVRNTLLEYERQKMLSEARDEPVYANDIVSADYLDNIKPEAKSVDFNCNTTGLVDRDEPHHTNHGGDSRFHSLAAASRRAVSNNYIPASLMSPSAAGPRDLQHLAQLAGDAETAPYPQQQALDAGDERGALRDAYIAHDMFATSCADDGYGTDSRSNTTASLSSPLSSSLSSLTTDSSSSLNGSQRGVGNSNGAGSARAQPVQSSGRLVMAKRGLLVKRRDLPPVERLDSLTLEDRLRALTTIEEEDCGTLGAPASQASAVSATRSALSASHSGAPTSNRRPAGDSAVYEDTSMDYESLYTVINKNRQRAGNSHPSLAGARQRQHRGDGQQRVSDRPGAPHRARGGTASPQPPTTRLPASASASGDGAPSGTGNGFHRAVPVRVDADGNAYYPAAADETGGGSARIQEDASGGLGLGGVRVTDSGEIEIDYSYYMKATPSESNDELNTYSPTHQLSQPFGGNSAGRVPELSHGGALQEFRAGTHSPGGKHHRGGYPRDVRAADPHRSRLQDFEFSLESDQHFLRVQPRDSGLRQGGVMCSMPNLSMHAPSVSRRHNAESGQHDIPNSSSSSSSPCEPSRPAPELPPQAVLRRNAPAGSGYPSGFRRPGQGERNSCDVGSLSRQAELSLNSPQPPGGMAADRMSLNLGDLPRIQEQLRATSEMLLSSGPKRHQFASSSDIYKLFQGQRGGAATGFQQGRAPPHRHSFHTFPSLSPIQNLSDVKSRMRPHAAALPTRADQSHASSVSGFDSVLPGHGPIRGNHNISAADRGRYASARNSRESECAPKRGLGCNSDGGESTQLRDTLARGQQFVTDIVLDEEGEKLSTLV